MKINTSKFGEVEVEENLIFDFIEPILGYEELKKYVLIDYDNTSPIKWLQSIEESDVAFPVTIPALFDIQYVFTVPEEEAKRLEITKIEDILTLNIINMPQGNPKETTVNLLAPLVINMKNRKAIQMILPNEEYSVREKLFKDGTFNISRSV